MTPQQNNTYSLYTDKLNTMVAKLNAVGINMGFIAEELDMSTPSLWKRRKGMVDWTVRDAVVLRGLYREYYNG